MQGCSWTTRRARLIGRGRGLCLGHRLSLQRSSHSLERHELPSPRQQGEHPSRPSFVQPLPSWLRLLRPSCWTSSLCSTLHLQRRQLKHWQPQPWRWPPLLSGETVRTESTGTRRFGRGLAFALPATFLVFSPACFFPIFAARRRISRRSCREVSQGTDTRMKTGEKRSERRLKRHQDAGGSSWCQGRWGRFVNIAPNVHSRYCGHSSTSSQCLIIYCQ